MSEQNHSYADKLITAQRYNIQGIEVEGVRRAAAQDSTDKVAVEVDNEAPEFYSLYLRYKDGSAQCCADFDTAAEALDHAQALHNRYGLPVANHTKAN